MRVVGKVTKKTTGTRVRYWADRQIFAKDAGLSIDELHNRARQTAFLVPGLTIVVRDERGGEAAERDVPLRRRHQRVLRVPGPRPDRSATCCGCRASGSFKETVPVLDDQGHMTPTEVERELTVDVALRWGTGYDTVARSFVNIIATPKGGTHVAGLRAGADRDAQRRAALASACCARPRTTIIKDDALEGLTAIVTVRLAEPQFEGQTKEVLGTSAASSIVASVVGRELKAALINPKRGGQGAGPGDPRQGRLGGPDPGRGAPAQGAAAAQERARDVVAAGQAGRLPQRRRRAQRAVHRRGRLRAGHGQAGAQQRVPGAAADPRQDPQRAEGLGRRHAQERRVRGDHPGDRGRLGPHLRPRRRRATAGSS